MNLPITGGCLCGAVRYESSVEPVLMLKCHCRDCQQISGGPYVPAVVFPLGAFRFTQGEPRRHRAESEGGGHNLRGFCPDCGSRLTGVEDPERGIIAVVASSLDDPSIFAARYEIFTDDAQPWAGLEAGTKKFPRRLPR